MKIYLASPFFNGDEKNNVIKLINKLRHEGHFVYVPMEHNIKSAWALPNDYWAKKVFIEDINAIKACDCVVAIYKGLSSDSGTSWEIGYAYGINKPVYVIHDYTFYKNGTSLMIWNSATQNIDFENLEYLFEDIVSKTSSIADQT